MVCKRSLNCGLAKIREVNGEYDMGVIPWFPKDLSIPRIEEEKQINKVILVFCIVMLVKIILQNLRVEVRVMVWEEKSWILLK